MEINNKFNIGDTIWTIINDKVTEAIIIDFVIENTYSGEKLPLEDRLRYELNKRNKIFDTRITKKEEEVFATKEKLIASL